MESSNLIHVLVVAEAARARGAMRRVVWPVPDITLAGEAANQDEAVQEARAHRFDVAVVDLALPAGEGPALLAWLAREFPGVAAVAVTDTNDEAATARACGAVACVSRFCQGEQLASAIRAAAVHHWDRDAGCARCLPADGSQVASRPWAADRPHGGLGAALLMTRLG